MRRNTKVKAAANRTPLRKSALSASAASRRAFPAWIDANDGSTFSAVTARVRDALVLRTVNRKKSAASRSTSHEPGAR
jgi:hypothetical protein